MISKGIIDKFQQANPQITVKFDTNEDTGALLYKLESFIAVRSSSRLEDGNIIKNLGTEVCLFINGIPCSSSSLNN